MTQKQEDMGASPDGDRAGGLRPEPAAQSQPTALIPSAVETSAEISPCGQYRYWLARKWDAGAMSLPIVMLNPSTADASNDDPTIRRCMAFARRERFGGIRVFNLFAYRATSPADMRAAADPIGPGNDLYLSDMFDIARMGETPVLAAWGAHGDFKGRASHVRSVAKFVGADFVCLGTTADGHPRHPLYVRGDQPFVPFPAQRIEARSDETAQPVRPEGREPDPEGDAPTPSHPGDPHNG